jgi:hypothetical protein
VLNGIRYPTKQSFPVTAGTTLTHNMTFTKMSEDRLALQSHLLPVAKFSLVCYN